MEMWSIKIVNAGEKVVPDGIFMKMRSMTLETTGGMVSLSFDRWGRSILLNHPQNIEVPDELIKETLGVTLAKLEDIKGGVSHLWGKYYSERLPEGGRVWIYQADYGPTARLPYIHDGKMMYFVCGPFETHAVGTIFHYYLNYSKEDPDGVNDSAKNIMAYLPNFTSLLIEIAKLVGDIKGINLYTGGSKAILYTPESLAEQGYQLKRFKEDGTEYAYTRTKEFEIMLESGIDFMKDPIHGEKYWQTVIRYPASNELTAESLLNLFESFNNSDDSCSEGSTNA